MLLSVKTKFTHLYTKFLNTGFFCNNTKLLPTAREANVFTGISQSFCSESTSWLLSPCSSLLQRGRYASYWNAFLFNLLQRDIFDQDLFKCKKSQTTSDVSPLL